MLSTTAEPKPWVAITKAASVPRSPFLVSRRNPSAPPAAEPPGTVWLMASVESWMRSSVRKPGSWPRGISAAVSLA